MTACGNDYGFEYIYERVLRSIGKRGDCLLVISTSGNSKNILLAVQAAQSMGIKVFGFLGCQGGTAVEFCDEVFIVPNDNVGRIQESHITAGHALMECIEDTLIEGNYLTLK
jgi:D-sedoheptulose 7-phosphate isomerase